MKNTAIFITLSFFCFSHFSYAQYFSIDPHYYTAFDSDSLTGFDEPAARQAAIDQQFLGSELKIMMYRYKRDYINNKYNLVKAYQATPYKLEYGIASRPAAAPGCLNEDFEASDPGAITGSTQVLGWTVTKGFNAFSPPTSTASPQYSVNQYYANNFPLGSNSCNLMSCCPLPPMHSAIIDCSAPGGFIDLQIGTHYPIFSVFGSGTTNTTAASANPQLTTQMFGNKVLRLNDGITGDYSIEKLSKTFSVTANNALFQFAFISVFAPGHGCCDAGGFQIKLSNATTNSVITCPQFSVSAPSSACTATLPMQYYVATTGAVYNSNTYPSSIYNRWKINSMDLSAYIGQNITVDVVVSDCTAGGHFGKVYFDAQCGPMIVNGNYGPIDAPVNSDAIVPFCTTSPANICASAGLGPYSWSGPGITSNQSVPSLTNQCITTSVSSTYTLTMHAVGHCSPIVRVIKTVIADSILAPKVLKDGEIVNLCAEPQVTIFPTLQSTNTPYTYEWGGPENANVNSLTTKSITVNTPGNYAVYIKDQKGCRSYALIPVVYCVGISENLNSGNINIYPNPFSNIIHFTLSNNSTSGILKLYNFTGQLILESPCEVKDLTLDTRQLKKGIYFLSFELDNGKSITKKLIKE